MDKIDKQKIAEAVAEAGGVESYSRGGFDLLAGMGRELCYRRSSWDQILWRDHVKKSEEVRRIIEKGMKDASVFAPFVGELFSRLFDLHAEEISNEKWSGPECGWAHQVHVTVDDMPEWKQLVSQTAGEEFWSAVGAQSIAGMLLGKLPEMKSDPQEQREIIKFFGDVVTDSMSDSVCETVTSALENAKAKLRQLESLAGESSAKANSAEVRNAVRGAVRKTLQKIVKQSESVRQIGGGWGSGVGRGKNKLNYDTINETLNLLDHEKIKRILEIVGRMNSIAARKQESKVRYGRSEIHGVTVGRDIEHVLPEALVKLAHPLLKRTFQVDLLEGRVPQYDLRGKEKEGRGPIVLLIDTSGSMAGGREIWAKAVAIALLSIAKKQRRSFMAITFDVKCQVLDIGKDEDVNSWHRKLVQWLLLGSNGGTSFEVPIKLGMDSIEREAGLLRADMVIITDGECGVSKEFSGVVKEHMSRHGWIGQAVIIGAKAAGAALAGMGFKVFGLAEVVASKSEEETLGDIFSL